MIVVLKHGVSEEKKAQLIAWLEALGLRIHISDGEFQTVLGLIGDTTTVDIDLVESLEIVDSVKRVTEPFKCCNRKFHPDDMVVEIGDVKVGGGNFVMIAGPCSVESEEQIVTVAKAVKAAGAQLMRGGAFKPRTSPYDFAGLKATGLEYLKVARQETGLPIVTELMNIMDLPLFEDVDVIQVGARNMQNFDLLRELGHLDKPILLKRGLANTLKELLMSAEYIMASGNERVMLCERGIRTFSDYTRNTLDLAAVPMLHQLTHLPVIVDPSHATGIAKLVPPMALAATAGGADGLIIEVHNDPIHALCDGAQSLRPEEFAELAEKIRAVRGIVADVDGELTKENVGDCDLVLVTIFPEAAIKVIRDFAPYFGKKPLVMDCCGTKRVVCEAVFPIAEEYGFLYVGGHPMAGTQYSGYKYAKATMYHNAPLVIVPPKYDDIFLLDHVKELLSPAGFSRISVTTAEKHDEMIAFTSQLAHVVSNAYVKSPTSRIHHGFSAGSYKDLTRVAWLNAPMWAELFLENKDYLLSEINGLMEHLDAYRRAMEEDNREELITLLDEGKRIKEEVDGK